MLRAMKLFLVCCLILCGFAWVNVVSACGGFLCGEEDVFQFSERVVFTINGDGTITMIIDASFGSRANNFSWIIPVPSEPSISSVERDVLDKLQWDTKKEFITPPMFCSGEEYEGKYDRPFLVDISASGEREPVQVEILHPENIEELTDDLQNKDTILTDDQLEILADYISDGMYFVVLDYEDAATRMVRGIRPIAITYEAEYPTLPIRLTASGDVVGIPYHVWIFADEYYVPENYTILPEVDYAQMRAQSKAAGAMDKYRDLQRDLLDDYEGMAFAIDYTGTIRILEAASERYESLKSLLDLSHLTILYTETSRAQATRDPIFIPSSELPNVPLTVDFSKEVERLTFWECSTRNWIDTEAEALIQEYTSVNKYGLLPHPRGWELSIVAWEYFPFSLVVFAPEPVRKETIRAYLNGQKTVPLLIYGYPSAGLDEDQTLNDMLDKLPASFTWNSRHELGPRRHVFMLTTQSDWDMNQSLYEAIFDFYMSYQFFSHSELRHTMFVAERPHVDLAYAGTGYYFAFPEGWVEHATSDNELYFLPEGVEDMDQAIRVKIDSVQNYALPEAKESNRKVLNLATFDQIAVVHHLTADAHETLRDAYMEDWTCFFISPVSRLEDDSQRGYLYVRNHTFIVVSATEDTPIDDATLYDMTESFRAFFEGCG